MIEMHLREIQPDLKDKRCRVQQVGPMAGRDRARSRLRPCRAHKSVIRGEFP
jgi:hypothetical protein